MALQLTENYKGVSANYWKITDVEHRVKENRVIVLLSLYLDQQTRQADVENYLKSDELSFDGLDYTRADLYAKIKQTNKFSSATDV